MLLMLLIFFVFVICHDCHDFVCIFRVVFFVWCSFYDITNSATGLLFGVELPEFAVQAHGCQAGSSRGRCQWVQMMGFYHTLGMVDSWDDCRATLAICLKYATEVLWHPLSVQKALYLSISIWGCQERSLLFEERFVIEWPNATVEHV